MRYPPHTHACKNKALGCKGTYQCSADPERDEDGTKYCSVNPMDDVECEDCLTSYCDECGVCLNVTTHDIECPKASIAVADGTGHP